MMHLLFKERGSYNIQKVDGNQAWAMLATLTCLFGIKKKQENTDIFITHFLLADGFTIYHLWELWRKKNQ